MAGLQQLLWWGLLRWGPMENVVERKSGREEEGRVGIGKGREKRARYTQGKGCSTNVQTMYWRTL